MSDWPKHYSVSSEAVETGIGDATPKLRYPAAIVIGGEAGPMPPYPPVGGVSIWVCVHCGAPIPCWPGEDTIFFQQCPYCGKDAEK